MSNHTIIEINHDLAHKFASDPDFGENLHTILAKRWPEDISRKLLQKYGITIMSQHHSSQRHELAVAGKAEKHHVTADKKKEHFTEADYQTWMKL